VEEFAQLFTGAREVAFELDVVELDGLPFHPGPPLILDAQHGLRARAERAVIEVRDIRIQQPVLFQPLGGNGRFGHGSKTSGR
jgi:hypothetical protein